MRLNIAQRAKGNHVFVNTNPAFMIVFSMAVSAAAIAAPTHAQSGASDTATTELDGRCDYRRQASKVGPGTGFARCTSLVITRSGSRGAIDYRRSLGGSEFRYEGSFAGNTMTIERLIIQGREAQAASGKCTLFHRGQQISTVTCVAKVGWKTFAGNFVTSRINP